MIPWVLSIAMFFTLCPILRTTVPLLSSFRRSAEKKKGLLQTLISGWQHRLADDDSSSPKEQLLSGGANPWKSRLQG